jgi:hypothetical protein
MTYLAIAWLVVLALAANAGAAVPDGLGLTVFFATLWALGFLYFRACRRWPVFGWLGLGLIAGLFGWSRPVYVHNEVTVDSEGNEVAVYDENCDAATDDTYCNGGGGSSDSRED